MKGEQGCSEPIVAGLAVIGSDRGPAPCGLIWEFTGASCISLRHISLMNLNIARIRSFTHPSCVCRQLVEVATGIQRTHFCIIFLYAISARCCNTEKKRHAVLCFLLLIIRTLGRAEFISYFKGCDLNLNKMVHLCKRRAVELRAVF